MSISNSKDNILIKSYRFLGTFTKAVFGFLKAVISFVVGCLLVFVSFQLLASIFRNWEWSSVLITSIYIILLAVIFILGSILILLPFRKWGWVTSVIRVLIMPLAGFLKLGNYYLGLAAIYFELIMLVAIGLIVFGGLRSLQPLHVLNDRVGYYLVFTLTILIFSFQGQKFTKVLIGKGKKQGDLDFAWIINLTQPTILRFVVYSIAAFLYIIANVEAFSGQEYLPWMWWKALKEIIVQVFLTYVAIDGAIVAWRDHKELVKTGLHIGTIEKEEAKN
jgi:hypothetical protein